MGIVINFPLHKCRAATRHFDEPAKVIVLPMLRIPRLEYKPRTPEPRDAFGTMVLERLRTAVAEKAE